MKNVKFITAGAGSGKTYRLTRDMVLSIRNGVKPSEIILTTFTKAAATEFRQKAIEALVKEGLTDEAMQMAGAKIGTIDSVCQSFVEKYWYLLGISPTLNVIASGEEQVFVNQSMDGLVTDDDIELFKDIQQGFGIKKYENNALVDNPEFWKEDIRKIVDYTRNYCVEDYANSIQKSFALVDEVFSGNTSVDWEYVNGFLSHDAKTIFTISGPKGGKKLEPKEHEKFDAETLAKRDNQYSKLLDAVKSMTGVMQNSSKEKYPFEDETAAISEGRGKTAIPVSWRTFKTACEEYLVSSEFADILKRYIERIFALATDWQSAYKEFKVMHGLIDYNDMESMFLTLLDNAAVAESIRADYKLIMVDEYQDCNPLQVEIFSKMSDILASRPDGCGQSVWVGDKKQSIYGFRGSDMELIDAVTSKFSLHNAVADSDGLEMDSLPDSYRSRKKLVEAANDMFVPVFGESEKLNPKRVYKGGDDMPDVPSLIDWPTSARNTSAYYETIAKKVKLILSGGDDDIKRVVDYEYTKDGYEQKALRKVRPEDIAILVRNNGDLKSVVEKLNAEGIMVSVAEQDLKDFAEIRLLLSILSYCIEKTDYAKASIQYILDGKSVPEIIKEKMDGALKDSNDVLKSLDAIIDKTKGHSLSQLVETIIIEFNLWARVAQWGEGARRRAHISTFTKVVAAYEEHTRVLGLAPSALGFLSYFDNYEIDKEPFAKIEGAVGVLTYHQSKGLEWPIVIMCQLDNNVLEEESIVSRSLLGVQHYSSDKSQITRAGRAEVITLLPRIVSKPMPDAIAQVLLPKVGRNTDIYNRVQQEEIRLLYVAFTRARDYVVTTSKTDGKYSWLENAGVYDETNIWKTREEIKVSDWDGVPESATEESDKYFKIEFHAHPSEGGVPKYVVPSSLRQKDMKCEVKVTSEVNLKSGFSIDLDNNIMRVVGSCIHDIYASYDASADREASVLKARTILKAHGLAEYEGKADSIIKAIETLYEHLTKTYGPAKSISHELPILVRSAEGQVMTGSIDLLWETEGGCVVVDFKNKEHDEDLPSSARGYAPQLSAYREALELANQNVDAMVLFYPLQSVVMELK